MNGMMQTVVVLVVVLVIAGLLKKALRRKGVSAKAASSYEQTDGLMSPAERCFFRVLEAVVADDFRLFAKVRLADVVQVKRTPDRRAWQFAFNKIQSKHLDFVAVDPIDMTVKFVVELDDKSHRKQSRQMRDELVDSILDEAGIPIFHFPARASYSEPEIRSCLFGSE